MKVRFAAKNLISLIVPISLCMVVVLLMETFVKTRLHEPLKECVWYCISHACTHVIIFVYSFPITPYQTPSNIGHIAANAACVLAAIIVMTFLIVLCVKYDLVCVRMKRPGYSTTRNLFLLYFTVILLIYVVCSGVGDVYADFYNGNVCVICCYTVGSSKKLRFFSDIIRSQDLTLDWISVGVFIYNFGVIGMISLFGNFPDILRQFYTCITCCMIVIQYIDHFHEYTVLALLAVLVFWGMYKENLLGEKLTRRVSLDVIAVLTPCGPLNMLVKLLKKKGKLKSVIPPGLVYSMFVTSILS